jgi:hypothetical protein
MLTAQLTFTNHTPIQSWKFVYQTTQDLQGNIWAASENGVIMKYDGSIWEVITIADYTSESCRAIGVVDENNIWVGTKDIGLLHYDGSTWTNYNTSNSTLLNDWVQDIKINSNGDDWVGTSVNGVAVISGTTWTIYDTSNNLPDGSVNDIEFDANGNVWLANNNYLVRKSGNTWTEWIISDINGHWASRANDLDFASNGDVYAATSKGIVVFDGTSWDTTQYLDGAWTSDYAYNSMAIDDDDKIWLGKINFGLLVHDIATDTLIGIYESDGGAVPSGQLYDIYVDSNNAKWLVGAGGGISEITDIAYTLPLTLASAKTDVLCNGDATGSITLNVNGGTSPFIYTWSDNSLSGANLANLPAGNYEVTITDSLSETISETFTILEPQALEGTTMSTSEQNMNGNGSASVSVSGGVNPFTYLWNDPNNQTTAEATNLSAGDYTVVVTDANGCTFEETVTVDMVIVPLTLASSKTDVLCNGDATGSITLTVDGGATPYTYTWSDNSLSGSMLTNLPVGNYEVTVTDNAAVALSETFTIQEPPVLEGTTMSIPEEDMNGNGSAMVSASGSVSPYTYLWNDSNNQMTAEAINLSAGDYVVTIIDANGCTLEEGVTVDMVTDINNISQEEINVTISPNPIANYFNIEISGMGDEISLTILSIEGKLMREQNLEKGSRQTIYVADMNSGFYFIKIQDENGKVYSEKIVIGK